MPPVSADRDHIVGAMGLDEAGCGKELMAETCMALFGKGMDQ